MSNSPVRLTFPDGTMLYTVGDSQSVQSRRLHDTREDAWNAYAGDAPEAAVSPEEWDAAEEDEELVVIETTYGSGKWTEMHANECHASKSTRLITRGPCHPEQDHGWGYGATG